jgi:hypothetical protein
MMRVARPSWIPLLNIRSLRSPSSRTATWDPDVEWDFCHRIETQLNGTASSHRPRANTIAYPLHWYFDISLTAFNFFTNLLLSWSVQIFLGYEFGASWLRRLPAVGRSSTTTALSQVRFQGL